MNIESAKYKEYVAVKKDGIIAIIEGTR